MSGLNIADIFETVVATVPDQPALVVRTGDGHDEVRFTFAELDARVNRLAHALLALGDRRRATTSVAISTTATSTSRSRSRPTRCARSR